MKCWVCQGTMAPCFTKDFQGQCGLSRVDYWKCDNCGFTAAKTLLDMTPKEWDELNVRYFSDFFGGEYLTDDPRRLPRLHAQAAAIANLAEAGLLPRELPWVDYGCGDGKLPDLLQESGLPVLKYDRYVAGSGKGYLTDEDLFAANYGLVINTAVFEHVRSITGLDRIAGLVDDAGVLALHVLVPESIPQDPTWFFLLPVHCAFYTNRSMQILFERWKFEASIYHLESRMWFCFRRDAGAARQFVRRMESGAPGQYYFKKGFMDYWK